MHENASHRVIHVLTREPRLSHDIAVAKKLSRSSRNLPRFAAHRHDVNAVGIELQEDAAARFEPLILDLPRHHVEMQMRFWWLP